MTAVEAPERYANDNGSMFWPPECDLTGWAGAAAVAQAWVKWDQDYERIKHRRWQQRFRCDGDKFADQQKRRGYIGRCNEEFDSTDAWRDHCAESHPGVTVGAHWSNQRWTWELLGFADHWDGRPMGWYNLLDGRDPSVKQWEADALELGTVAADHWRIDGQRPGVGGADDR